MNEAPSIYDIFAKGGTFKHSLPRLGLTYVLNRSKIQDLQVAYPDTAQWYANHLQSADPNYSQSPQQEAIFAQAMCVSFALSGSSLLHEALAAAQLIHLDKMITSASPEEQMPLVWTVIDAFTMIQEASKGTPIQEVAGNIAGARRGRDLLQVPSFLTDSFGNPRSSFGFA